MMRLILALVTFFCGTVALVAESRSFGLLDIRDEFRDQPIQVSIRTQAGAVIDAILLGREGLEIKGRPLGIDVQGVEIFTPIADITNLSFRPGDPLNQAREAFRNRSFERVSDLIRPISYTILSYQDIPSDNTFSILEMYLESLVQTSSWEEAFYFARQLRLTDAPSSLIQVALRLSRNLFEEGQAASAMVLVDSLPFEAERPDALDALLEFAHQLRRSDRFEEAILIYGRILGTPNSPLLEAANLWIAYANTRVGRLETARVFIDQLGEPLSPGHDYFSLLAMIEARILMQEERVQEAIRFASRGVIFARLDQEWAPDLLFVTAEAYEALEMPEQAVAIFNEILLFYPESIWADPSRDHLSQLQPLIET